MGYRSLGLTLAVSCVGLAAWTVGREPFHPKAKVSPRRCPISNHPILGAVSEGPAPPSGAGTRIVTTEEIPSNPRNRMEWLLDLPDCDLATLIGTKTLDGYVAEVLDLLADQDDHGSQHEIGQFLDQLNVRIRALQPRRPFSSPATPLSPPLGHAK